MVSALAAVSAAVYSARSSGQARDAAWASVLWEAEARMARMAVVITGIKTAAAYLESAVGSSKPIDELNVSSMFPRISEERQALFALQEELKLVSAGVPGLHDGEITEVEILHSSRDVAEIARTAESALHALTKGRNQMIGLVVARNRPRARWSRRVFRRCISWGRASATWCASWPGMALRRFSSRRGKEDGAGDP